MKWRKSQDLFLDSGFRTHIVATTVCTTGGVHTLRVARTFFWHSFFAWRTDIAYTHGSRCSQCACHISPSRPLHSHVSSAFLAVPWWWLRRPRLPCRTSPDPKARVKRTSARAPRSLATWPIPTHSTGFEPKEFDKITSVDGDTTPINDPNHDSISDFSKITRENTEQFGVPKMLETSLSHVFHGEFALEREIQESTPRETVARQRERKEKVLWSVLQSRCQGKVDGTVLGVILFRLTENSILMIEISEKTCNEELNKLFWKLSSEKIILDRVRHGDPELGANKFRTYIDWVATRAWISKTTIPWSQSMGRPSSAWENTLV